MQIFVYISLALVFFAIAIGLKLSEHKSIAKEATQDYTPAYWVLAVISSSFIGCIVFPDSPIGALALSIVCCAAEYGITLAAQFVQDAANMQTPPSFRH